jgi:hypothetical protein
VTTPNPKGYAHPPDLPGGIPAGHWADIKAWLAACPCEGGPCDSWGCGTVALLVAEVERLAAELERCRVRFAPNPPELDRQEGD